MAAVSFLSIPVLVLMVVTAHAHQIGSRCHTDEDCTQEVTSSTCEDGRCECLAHYVPFNASSCIQSALLGYSCLLDAQCQDRVENTTCDRGTCRCGPGFIPYKRHVCLPPARLEEICYNDDHCRLWDSDAQCDYILRNVIGRCRCSGLTRRVGGACLGKSSVSTNATPPLEPVQPRPTRPTGPMRPSGTVNPVIASLGPLLFVGPLRTVTLGLRCLSDAECLRADANSRCLNGVCDCMPSRNASNSPIPRCSALNTGCYPGTFQCKSSGECVSWFFVCDGRAHCADRSDEAGCDGPECPEMSFRCGTGRCVSRASLCDGTRDCPGGEDEKGCEGERSCPSYTLRCRGESPRCLPEHELCNAVKSCADGSDEVRAVCRGKTPSSRPGKRPRAPKAGITNSPSCPFRCGNGRCRSSAVVCSGRDGCGDNSDEELCTVCKCPAA